MGFHKTKAPATRAPSLLGENFHNTVALKNLLNGRLA